MRVLFVAQGESLSMFDRVRFGFARKVNIEKTGFIIADSWSYLKWLKNHPDFEQQGYYLLKEWEITSQRSQKTDHVMLREYEGKIGAEPGLFGAIVADRRLFMGRNCTYTQDYTRRFSDDELLSILQTALTEVERLFDELNPEIVVSFICVTMMDYLVYLFAKARGVRFLNIRPTRILDRVTAASTLNDPAPEFMHAYRRCLELGSAHVIEADQYIKKVREQHGRYEGVVRPSSKPVQTVNSTRKNLYQATLHVVKGYLDYRSTIAHNDNHVPNPLVAIWYAAVVNPLQAKKVSRRIGNRYISQERLASQRFVFFPLHTEPEVSLLVYGRPFVNQIELIRTVALSLPADMILVVKEHPWMVGKRSLSSYQKLLGIPRVHIANPVYEARDLVAQSSLVTVITSSVGLEAAILGRPVITFGDCPFNALPDNMVDYCCDLRRLPTQIKKLLVGYQHNDNALRAYVSAAFETSESINLYSVLLKKQGVHRERDSDYEKEALKLADYILHCSESVSNDEGTAGNVANW